MLNGLYIFALRKLQTLELLNSLRMNILVALLLTVNLFGNVSPDYITTNYYDPSVVISFDAWKNEALTVKIISHKSEVIYFDKLKTDSSDGIRYNMKHLADGKYTIRLENTVKLVEEKVILINGKIVEKDAKVYFKPVVNVNASNVMVSFLSYNGKADITILKKGEVVFEDFITNVKPLNKVYNTNELDKGEYSIRVSNDKVSKVIEFKK